MFRFVFREAILLILSECYRPDLRSIQLADTGWALDICFDIGDLRCVDVLLFDVCWGDVWL